MFEEKEKNDLQLFIYYFLMYLILNMFGSVLTCNILGGNKDKAVFSVKLKQITYKSLGF